MVGFNKKTIKDISLTGKRVLLRADYNVPDIAGKITDDFRIKQSIPTLEYILKQKPNGLIIMSHMGRPKGFDKTLSLQPVARHLSQLLGRKVFFVPDCVGEEVKSIASRLKPTDILLLENLRFYPGEEENETQLAKNLVDSTSAEIFVQDGFGVVHRAHASTVAITKLLPSVAGLLLEKEVETITKVMKSPNHPLVAIIGGAKIKDKIEVLHCLIDLADCVAIGGAMANNFLKIEGYETGSSLYDKEDLRLTKDILAKVKNKACRQPFSFLLPVDAIVSKNINGRAPIRIVDLSSRSLAEIEAYPKIPKRDTYTVGKAEAIFDIGPVSSGLIAGAVELAKTVIWNGTMGVTETKGINGAQAPFSNGTRTIAEAIIGPSNKHLSKAFSLVGGGDTVGYIEAEGLTEDFSHVSTGGGASLELMAGKELPGIEALPNK